MSRSWSRAPSTPSCSAPAPARTPPTLRRRIETGPEERDFPILEELYALGATDYLAQIFVYGETGDRSQGTGIAYSFATDRKGGFSDDDTTLVQATLPALVAGDEGPCRPCHRLGLAWRLSRRGRRTARPRRLDHARFGRQSARGDLVRRHPRLHAAQRRGAGPVVVELLNDVFEILTASLRERGGQVLKFIGDAMLAIFPFEDADRAETCRRALDAAIEAMRNIEALNAARAAAGAPVAPVDLALHLGERSTAMSARSTGWIHRHWSGDQRGDAHRGLVRAAWPRGAGFRRVRRWKKGADPAQVARPPRLRGVKEPKEIFALDLGARSAWPIS